MISYDHWEIRWEARFEAICIFWNVLEHDDVIFTTSEVKSEVTCYSGTIKVYS